MTYRTPLERLKGVWRQMHYRCKSPKSKSYNDYGARGITVCPEWDSFDQFYLDMGLPPHEGLTLEREDNDGPYCKANCVWADRTTQNQNRRNRQTNSPLKQTLQDLLGAKQ